MEACLRVNPLAVCRPDAFRPRVRRPAKLQAALPVTRLPAAADRPVPDRGQRWAAATPSATHHLRVAVAPVMRRLRAAVAGVVRAWAATPSAPLAARWAPAARARRLRAAAVLR